MKNNSSPSQGFIFAISCYIIWGVFPIYWRLLIDIPALTILANRMIWSAVFLLPFSLLFYRKQFIEIICNKKNIILMGIAGILITINWGTYIYAVNNGFILEGSLGYYINPLVNILLGVAFLKEKLDRIEIIATLLAFIGVSYFTISYGSFPWISIILACTLGIYGIIKKKANLPPIPALTLETLLIAPIAIFYLMYVINTDKLVISNLSSLSILLLIMGGVVTAIPLIMFAKAVKLLPYSTLGFIQYIGPTLQLLIGVFIYNEKFTKAHAICFIFIWLGLIMFTLGIIHKNRSKNKLSKL